MTDPLKEIRKAHTANGLLRADPQMHSGRDAVKFIRKLNRRMQEKWDALSPLEQAEGTARQHEEKIEDDRAFREEVENIFRQIIANHPDYLEVFDIHEKPCGYLDVSILLPEDEGFWHFTVQVVPEDENDDRKPGFDEDEFEFYVHRDEAPRDESGQIAFTNEHVLHYMKEFLKLVAPQLQEIELRIASNERLQQIIHG